MEEQQIEQPQQTIPVSPKKFPWKRLISLLIVLLVIGGGAYAIWAYQNDRFPFQKPAPPTETTPTPATLPEGKIVFVKSSYLSKSKTWDESIWIANKDGKNQKRLFTAPRAEGRKLWLGSASPEGKKVIYKLEDVLAETNHVEEILGILDLTTGQNKVIVKADSGPGSYPTGELVGGGIGDSLWYQEGKKIIYAIDDPGGKVGDLESTLWVYDLGTNKKEQLSVSRGILRNPFAISQDNNLYVEDITWKTLSAVITQIDLDSKGEEQVVKSTLDITGVILSPQGNKIVYSVQDYDEGEHEMWVVDTTSLNKHKILFEDEGYSSELFSICCMSPLGKKFLTTVGGDSFDVVNVNEDFSQASASLSDLVSEINESLNYRDPVIEEHEISWVSDSMMLVRVYESHEKGRDIVGLLDLNTTVFKKLLEDAAEPTWVPTQTSEQ